MKNKVLVNLKIPEIDMSFDLYIPINKKVGNIINLLNKNISEISNNNFKLSNSNILFDASTGQKYFSDVLVANTTIRNGTKLILLSNLKENKNGM